MLTFICRVAVLFNPFSQTIGISEFLYQTYFRSDYLLKSGGKETCLETGFLYKTYS
jgi:hypothetical protein